MNILLSSPILVAVGLAIGPALGTSSLAQSTPDPSLLPKNSFQWNQEELEQGFLHYDEVFPGRDVPGGDKVKELPQGLPIASFHAGGEKEKELEEFLTEQKVAGLLILQAAVSK
jgi:hypothetical protein